jgi:hypothetical protein
LILAPISQQGPSITFSGTPTNSFNLVGQKNITASGDGNALAYCDLLSATSGTQGTQITSNTNNRYFVVACVEIK